MSEQFLQHAFHAQPIIQIRDLCVDYITDNGDFNAVKSVSFDIGKAMTTGEGGMIITDNDDIFKKSREYSDHGHELNPKFPRGEDTRSRSGFNFKMTELQGAVGLAQLRKLDYIIERQRENKARIKEGIKHNPVIKFRELPNPEGDIGDTLVFFLPGFAWTLVFFPNRQLNVLERVALSFGLSIAIVTLSIIVLNKLVGLSLTAFNSFLVIMVVTIIPLAFYYLNRLLRKPSGDEV